MFVALACDAASIDNQKSLYDLITQYGFKKMAKDLFEHTGINEQTLMRLKRDIDRVTDSYDVIRIYQYPLQDTLVISSLKEKKWRKIIVRA